MAKKKPMSKRAQARLRHIRRDPLGRVGLEINRYLETIGWRAVVVGKVSIRGFGDGKKFGNYEFCLEFSGGKIQTPDDPQASR